MKRYQYPLPRIVFSRCLGFEACRYNALTIRSDAVNALKTLCQDVITDCPEIEIGLGVPRKSIRVVINGEEKRLMQPATGRDVTDEMKNHTLAFFNEIGDIDGFVLKNRSPSCGIKAVKYYPSMEEKSSFDHGTGLFGGMVMEHFPSIPTEDEGRLKDFDIRYNFYVRVFTWAQFRGVKDSGRMAELVRFHSVNKYLFMAYNQSAMRQMGKIVANHGRLSFDEVIPEYEKQMVRLFARAARVTANINVLEHCMGYFKDELSKSEKDFFLELLDGYRNGRKPLSVPMEVMQSWIIRFENKYLSEQRFFQPFPWDLIDKRST